MKQYTNYLLLLIPGAVWGASFVITNLALDYMQPFTIGFGRSAISAVFLCGVLYWLGGRLPSNPRDWFDILWLALMNMSAFLLTAWGQLSISSGLTTILAATIPFFTIILAHIVTDDEKINRVRLLGIGMGLIGVVILIGFDALQELGRETIAQLAILLASALYAAAGIYIRDVLARQPEGKSPWEARIRVVTTSFIWSSTLVLPLALIVDRPWTVSIPPIAIGYLVALGIGVTTFATLIYYYLVQSLGPTISSMTMYIIPISGVLLGVLLLGEVVTPSMPVAGVFILGGVYVINRPRQASAAKQA